MVTLHPRLKEDLTNREIGLLTVKEYLGRRDCLWRCECACGKTVEIPGGSLRNNSTHSCGCDRPRKLAALKTKHGHAQKGNESPEYRAWLGMIDRCERKSHCDYHNYGGRGIKVCQRWRENFAAFLTDMGPKPAWAHSIDRRENNGDYEPGNCRWATQKEQARNTRTNRLLTFDNETKPLVEWAEVKGLPMKLLHQRLSRGWDLRRALTTPNS